MDPSQITQLEKNLDSFDYDLRLKSLRSLAQASIINQPVKTSSSDLQIDHNMHIHSFYSFNYCGYSPVGIAWHAKKAGFGVTGMVDFDVLDGVDEFSTACKMLDLPGVAGMETRVFVPDFPDKEFTSPGEPGITYFVGLGFTGANIDTHSRQFLTDLKATAQQRNRQLAERLNKYLSPVELDYQKDVLSATPAGNPTERHLCAAYIAKARQLFPQPDSLSDFWSDKLGLDAAQLDLPDSLALVNALRRKCMKKGGAGYVQPDKGAFPDIKNVADFITACGAVPAMTWLDGTSDGEQQIESFIQTAAAQHNVSAIVIIPDRNYTTGRQDTKLQNLCDIVAIAQKHNLFVTVGTEMNSPGQKFVNDFNCRELKPLAPVFLDGACGIYGHTVMQSCSKMGMLSDWARKNFNSKKNRNIFFTTIGKKITPASVHKINGISRSMTPEQILKHL